MTITFHEYIPHIFLVADQKTNPVALRPQMEKTKYNRNPVQSSWDSIITHYSCKTRVNQRLMNERVPPSVNSTYTHCRPTYLICIIPRSG